MSLEGRNLGKQSFSCNCFNKYENNSQYGKKALWTSSWENTKEYILIWFSSYVNIILAKKLDQNGIMATVFYIFEVWNRFIISSLIYLLRLIEEQTIMFNFFSSHFTITGPGCKYQSENFLNHKSSGWVDNCIIILSYALYENSYNVKRLMCGSQGHNRYFTHK